MAPAAAPASSFRLILKTMGFSLMGRPHGAAALVGAVANGSDRTSLILSGFRWIAAFELLLSKLRRVQSLSMTRKNAPARFRGTDPTQGPTGRGEQQEPHGRAANQPRTPSVHGQAAQTTARGCRRGLLRVMYGQLTFGSAGLIAPKRFPVAVKIAGAIGGTPRSPTQPGGAARPCPCAQ